jgi:hypothetical protein
MKITVEISDDTAADLAAAIPPSQAGRPFTMRPKGT